MYLHKTPFFAQWVYPSLLWHKSREEKKIYLTFDDGPIPEVTEFVLEMLGEYQALGTFFCVGDNVRKHPHIFRRILDGGHAVGNHTYNHLDGWGTEMALYLKNIGLCQKEMEHHGQRADERRLFRPPYGKITRKQLKTLRNHYQIVMWDVLSADFDAKLSPDKCLKGALSATRPGAVVVFHDSVKSADNLMYALPRYLSFWHDKGYTFDRL